MHACLQLELVEVGLLNTKHVIRIPARPQHVGRAFALWYCANILTNVNVTALSCWHVHPCLSGLSTSKMMIFIASYPAGELWWLVYWCGYMRSWRRLHTTAAAVSLPLTWILWFFLQVFVKGVWHPTLLSSGPPPSYPAVLHHHPTPNSVK